MVAPLRLVKSGLERIERMWLRRWYLASRMKATRLDLRLDMSTVSTQIRATAELGFRPTVTSARFTCLLGDVRLHSVTWGDRPVKARVNSPFLVLTFPIPIESMREQTLQIRYAYAPDEYGTIVQPITREDCPERVWITCRRPLLGLVQGRLVQGTESPPLRTYQWDAPRSRKLNAIVADVRSFKKETAKGPAIWLHLHADAVPLAPRILDLAVTLYEQSAETHHSELPYKDLHIVESDERAMRAFNSGGLIVVPRGTFATDDKPRVHGILAPELNKEWNREVSRWVATGQPD